MILLISLRHLDSLSFGGGGTGGVYGPGRTVLARFAGPVCGGIIGLGVSSGKQREAVKEQPAVRKKSSRFGMKQIQNLQNQLDRLLQGNGSEPPEPGSSGASDSDSSGSEIRRNFGVESGSTDSDPVLLTRFCRLRYRDTPGDDLPGSVGPGSPPHPSD